MSILRVLGILVPGLIWCASLSAQDGLKLALVVGVNQYDRLSPLRVAVNDALNVTAHFQAAGFDQVWTLSDMGTTPISRPSLVNFQILMENVEKLSTTETISELVVFFAGHGVQIEGQNYLCFPEADLQGKRGLLSVDRELIPWLRRVPARLALTFLDACREDLGPTRSAGVTRGLVLPPSISATPGRNIMVAYSARPGEFAYEKPDGSGGFFTEVFLEALRKADQLTISQLAQFLRTQLPQQTQQVFGKLQMPSFGGDFDPEATLTSTVRLESKAQSLLRLHSDCPVAALYLNEQAQPLNQDATLTVAPGEYFLRAVSGQEFWEANVMIAGAGTVTVIPDWKPAGTLQYSLPPASALEITHSTSTRVLLLENDGSIPYLETGTWMAKTVGSAYEPWKCEIAVEKGQVVRLAPPLRLLPGNERKIQRAILVRDRDRAEAALPSATRIRAETQMVPVTAAVGGIGFSVAGASLWAWSELAYADYKAATNSQDAQTRRELVQTLDLMKFAGLGLGAVGLATWAGYEALPPHPERLNSVIQRLDAQILEMDNQEESP